jgi:GPN-loop GTPase
MNVISYLQDRESMLHLMRVVDRATGCVFAPPANIGAPPDVVDTSGLPADRRPNIYSLFTTAIGPLSGPRSDVRDVQERWLGAKEEFDAHEHAQWRQEGAVVAEATLRVQAAQTMEAAREGTPRIRSQHK